MTCAASQNYNIGQVSRFAALTSRDDVGRVNTKVPAPILDICSNLKLAPEARSLLDRRFLSLLGLQDSGASLSEPFPSLEALPSLYGLPWA
jgi:hypothetical protein